MSKGIAKLVAALIIVVILLAILGVLAVNARLRGRESHCRNNLRRLGGMIHGDRLNILDEAPAERGREFWQMYRRREYYNEARKTWLRRGELNPFSCPVLGRGPESLSTLNDAEFEKVMSDSSTIDYRGPRELKSGRIVLGADRDGNHGKGGFVLLADLSVAKGDAAVDVGTDWSQAVQSTD